MIYNRLIVAAIGFIRLEPYDGKLSRTVLRGGKDSNALLLPDYASVEMLYHPEYVGKPLAVGGDSEARHGIVLTANYIAKRSGVKTGMALWQAKQVCPDLIFVPPRMDLYLKFSSMLREIYSEYTNQVEPYGCDEAWLDVTDSFSLKGDGRKIAEEINRRVKKELGITVSIGISWNKIFAKLGSDYKKPDGITEFNRTNYRELIWKLPVSDLLYVGRTDPDFLELQLGKMGLVIYSFANGWDDSPVSVEGYQAPIKSIGNSTTTPRDLENDQDVQIILMALAESVAARLRKHGFKCNVVSISIRDNGLFHFSRQRKLQDLTDITDEIMSAAYQLFRENYHWPRPIRSLGIRADDLVMGQVPVQLDLFMNEQRREKQEKLDRAVDDIRRRFGYHSVQRAFMYQDKILSSLDAQGSHTVHPVGYFNGR